MLEKVELRKTEQKYEESIREFEERLEKTTGQVQSNLIKQQDENEHLQEMNKLAERTEQLNEAQKQLLSRKPRPISPLVREERHITPRTESQPASPSITNKRASGSYSSLSDLLSDTEPKLASSQEREKEQALKIQHLAELLNDSEATGKRLEEQEKLLKEEIRRMDRMEKRQDMSIEYLKNVVLKFLESSAGEREQMTAVAIQLTILYFQRRLIISFFTCLVSGSVISTILQLSPEEAKSLKENAVDNGPGSPVMLGYGVL
ncbi:8283_t:CDS:2 [Paraglomus brasilianum]|uniref:8283_t:CDS:1 n=1 Tax=Paraglomus brasilianum TaxID=144538 RepID=A0A9N8ZZ16_9GLOM|nr:8283_t:CDS:2 [Paraglomus brasilianum]